MKAFEQTEEERAATPTFVALCPTCKCLLACAVDQPEYAKENAKAVASWIRDGLELTKWPVSQVRTSTFCKCERKKKERRRHER